MRAGTAYQDPLPTGALILADGTVFYGYGAGKTGEISAEICFNTSMTGYQEILTDPSYAGQTICFSFPHIGNVGTNPHDEESTPSSAQSACGAIFRSTISPPSSWRAEQDFETWLEHYNIIALTGIDTRALTAHLRENGMVGGVLTHQPDGDFDLEALRKKAEAWGGMEHMDLATQASVSKPYRWHDSLWSSPTEKEETKETSLEKKSEQGSRFRVVVIDYGVKANILRCLKDIDCSVDIVPAHESAEAILARQPDGIVLSNGPGDPAALHKKINPTLKKLIKSQCPVLGICLGHQLLALTLGGETEKMEQGHHGANHPVKDLEHGVVTIVSMNHGFAVKRDSLPSHLTETHISLFDGSNCGLAMKDAPVFSVQYHPEASPGPQDAFTIFKRFARLMEKARTP